MISKLLQETAVETNLKFLFVYLFLFRVEQTHQMKATEYRGQGREEKRRKKKDSNTLPHFLRISFLSLTKLCSFSCSAPRMTLPARKNYWVWKSRVECSSRTGPALQPVLKWCQEMGGGREGEHSEWHSPQSGNSLGKICGKPEIYSSKAP